MFIENNHLLFMTGKPEDYGYHSKLYMDFYVRKPNLKLNYEDSNAFILSIGIFNRAFFLELKWGYKEREKTQDEIDREVRIQELILEQKESNER